MSAEIHTLSAPHSLSLSHAHAYMLTLTRTPTRTYAHSLILTHTHSPISLSFSLLIQSPIAENTNTTHRRHRQQLQHTRARSHKVFFPFRKKGPSVNFLVGDGLSAFKLPPPSHTLQYFGCHTE